MTDHAFTVVLPGDANDYLFAEARAASTSPDAILSKLVLETIDERQKYNAWFIRQVQIGIDELDDPNAVLTPNEVVQAEWKLQRAELIARAEAQGL